MEIAPYKRHIYISTCREPGLHVYRLKVQTTEPSLTGTITNTKKHNTVSCGEVG